MGTGDFFPLTVLYQEKLYAAGKIPGGFLKREGRPSEHETLTSRLIDRPIRPLFAEGFRNEVQVINTVMSADPDCSSQMAAMLGSSIALTISDIPFNGPIAGVIVGRVDGELVINPTVAQIEKNTDAVIRALEKYPIDVVTPPGYALAVNFERLSRCCKQTNTYFEMNGKRINFGDDELLKMQQDNVKLIINSDAHSPERVGECNHALNMVTKLNINKELLVNVDKLPIFKNKG